MLSATRQVLRDQQIDLAQEKFAFYVPAMAPPESGYGLLVFVQPWPQANTPGDWRETLDRHGLIFVTAANSGNDVKVLDRRMPLALLAYENIRSRYPLDPRRVYVGGLSGGSRVAEMTALAYPDVFHGALLNAGSDPIGGEIGIYLPPADLFEKFQRTRLVFVTGHHDERNLTDDGDSLQSMRDWCVFNVVVHEPPRLGHEPLDSNSLDRALAALEQSSPIDVVKLAQCNAKLLRELSAKLADADAAIARGDTEGARARIKQIDAHYGGLASPAILDLDKKLTARR